MIFEKDWLDSRLMEEAKPPQNSLTGHFKPLKQGVLENQGAFEACLYSTQAASIFFQIFSPSEDKMIQKISLSKGEDSLFHAKLPTLDPELRYNFLIDNKVVIDPYAKSLSPSQKYGTYCHFTFDHTFDWQGVQSPQIAPNEMIIYEMHIKGFSKRSPCEHVPGTYLAAIEKIPHLQKLGVNTIELLPIMEFDVHEYKRTNPETNEKLVNYWGYNTVNFHAPARHYAGDSSRLGAINELKTMIREFHRAGIKVIMDVVYNHVSTLMGLETIDMENYFILDTDKKHTNYTGCGNTIQANSNASLNLILSSLRHFAAEYRIDGFRYDLGGALTRDKSGNTLNDVPLFELIKQDPLLKDKVHMAEPWDAGGCNKQGSLQPDLIHEWNGSFKYATRKYLNRINQDDNAFIEAIKGSPWTFTGDTLTPVNYITVHDGFSLHDLVSYQEKHNLANGEDNRDGDDYNDSINYGVEGQTDQEDVMHSRMLAMKNFWLANMTAKGISLIRMGDEYGHTQSGNNNVYCQDNDLSWFDWDLLEKNHELFTFSAQACQIRKEKIARAKKIESLNPSAGIAIFIYDDITFTAFNMSDQECNLQEVLGKEFDCLITTSGQTDTHLPPYSSMIGAYKRS